MSPEAPIPYLSRIRSYYQALGFSEPYVWAQFEDVPFTPLAVPLAAARVALVTTAAPFQPDKGDQGPGASYNAAAKFYKVYALPIDSEPDLRISHVAIDRDHTTAEDQNSYFPLKALRRAVDVGRIGSLTPHVFGLPTNRSQQTTIDIDCPDLVARVTAEMADAAILVPNCPVCHQSVSLAAHALERAGIATVIMGCALDIVEHIGVPRFVFSDFPLGNSAGRPNDTASQDQTLAEALDLLSQADAPRTTVASPLVWNNDHNWKLDYCNIDRLTAVQIAERRISFNQGKETARGIRNSS